VLAGDGFSHLERAKQRLASGNIMTSIPKKHLGLGLVLLGVIVFVLGTENKSDHLVTREKTASVAPLQVLLPVKAGHDYRVGVWGEDEERGLQHWADMELEWTVAVDGRPLYRNRLQATASAGEEKSAVRRAQNGEEYRYRADADGSLELRARLLRGDKLELVIYRDLDEQANLLPGLGLLTALGGLVLYLRGRNGAREDA
jgi:hypothetical protein